MQSPSHRHPVRLRETHLDRCAPDVGDDTRQGALRFRIPGSDDFLREPSRVPSPSGRHSDGRVRRAAPGTLRPHRPQCCVNGLSRQLALRPELVAGRRCPNLPQRSLSAFASREETAESCGSCLTSRIRSGSLWQIWTTRAAASPRKGSRRSDGDRGGPPTGRTGTAGRRGRALTGLTCVPLRRGRPAVRTRTRTGGRRP